MIFICLYYFIIFRVFVILGLSLIFQSLEMAAYQAQLALCKQQFGVLDTGLASIGGRASTILSATNPSLTQKTAAAQDVLALENAYHACTEAFMITKLDGKSVAVSIAEGFFAAGKAVTKTQAPLPDSINVESAGFIEEYKNRIDIIIGKIQVLLKKATKKHAQLDEIKTTDKKVRKALVGKVMGYCNAFNTTAGCKLGDNCPYKHILRSTVPCSFGDNCVKVGLNKCCFFHEDVTINLGARVKAS